MSGGHYDYNCHRVQAFYEQLETKNNPRRIAFKKLMKLVANACYEIEWEDSGDSSNADEAMDTVFKYFNKKDPATVAKAQAYDGLVVILRKYIDAWGDKNEVNT